MTIAQDDTLLDTWLRGRRSCRAFTPEPVPRATIERMLTLAQRTASWNNVQPWEVTIASGAACDRLRAALVARAASGREGLSKVLRWTPLGRGIRSACPPSDQGQARRPR